MRQRKGKERQRASHQESSGCRGGVPLQFKTLSMRGTFLKLTLVQEAKASDRRPKEVMLGAKEPEQLQGNLYV